MSRIRTTLGCSIAIATALAVSSCGFNPADVTLPGTSVPGPTYRVDIEFTNVLNLPAQAKVVANGARIGTLHSLSVVDPSPGHPGHAMATVDIEKSVQLPPDTTAQLRQNTILGDIFIGLTIPRNSTGTAIPPGGVIPLNHTEPPLQIEDLMAGMATFVNGGAIQRFQDIINSTNAVLPDNPQDTAHMADVLGQDTHDLAGHLDTIDGFLDVFQKDLNTVLGNPRAVDDLLSARGAREVPADTNSLVLTLGIIGGLGVIGGAVQWLGPYLHASDSAAKALVPLFLSDQPLDLSAPSNMNHLVSLLRNKIIPFAEDGLKFNITGVRAEQSGQPVSRDVQVDNLISTLRMIGVVR